MSLSSTRRFVAAVAVAGFGGVAMLLLWTDWGPLALDPAKDLAISMWRAVERAFGSDIADRDDLPGAADQIGHAALWGTGMFVIGWVLRRRVPILLTAVFVVGLSMVFEFAQPTLTSGRVLEPTDVVANTIGVALGTTALMSLVWATRAVFGDDREYFDERTHW